MYKTTVFINGRFLTQRLTGVQRHALETLRALDHLLESGAGCDEFEFCLLAPRDAPQPELSHIAFVRTDGVGGNAWEQFVLPWLSRSGWLLSFGPTGPIVRKRQVVTMHDAAVCAVPEAFGWKFRLWYRLLLPVLAQRSPRVMTVSHFSKGELERHFGASADKIRIAGGGWQHVTRLRSDVAVLAAHGLTPQRYVLTVSSVSPHKNLAVVARAVEHLREEGFSVAAVGGVDNRIFDSKSFAGGGGRASRVLKTIGHVDDEGLRALYENAAAFVFPSYYEGFGIPPLEAMALGCPVIASTAASIPETCGSGALYFAPDDAEALAGLIARVTGDVQLRAAQIARGREQLLRHSWETAARHYLDMLRELRAAERGPAEAGATAWEGA